MCLFIYLLREHTHKHLHHDVYVVRSALTLGATSLAHQPYLCHVHRELPETFGNVRRYFSLPLLPLSNRTLFGFLRHWSHGACYFSSVARARLYVKSVTLDVPFLLGYIKWSDFPTIFRAWLKSKH